MNFKWLESSAWMQNPNVRLALFVLSAAMPAIIGDLSAGKVTGLTAAVVLANMLLNAKAFMSDPDEGSVPGVKHEATRPQSQGP